MLSKSAAKVLPALLISLALPFMIIASSWGEQIVKKSNIDSSGIFSVYREMDDPVPFIPHGWMPAEAAQMIKVFDLGCQKDPHNGNTCLAITIEWSFPWWAGIAWITEDGWWGESDKGPVFDLTGAKRLIFSLKGKNGNERVQVKIGILWDKPFGDVIKRDQEKIKEIESEWLTLTKKWEEYTIDLEGFDLSKIANGFTFVSSQQQQADEVISVSFFIDDIYYSWTPEPYALNNSRGNLVTTWGKIKRSF